MIDWVDERLQGEAIYNIVGATSLNGVHFKLANEVVRQGTPFSAENMDAIVQKLLRQRCFYYGGEETVTVGFPVAADGLRQGVILAKAYAGMELAAEGTVYMVADGRTQRLDSPVGWRVVRDCVIYCQMGDEVVGMVTRRG